MKITKSQLKQIIQEELEKAAQEILATRMGSYAGTTLPGGKKIPSISEGQKTDKPRLEPWM